MFFPGDKKMASIFVYALIVFAVSMAIIAEILVARQKRLLKKQMQAELDAAEKELKKSESEEKLV